MHPNVLYQQLSKLTKKQFNIFELSGVVAFPVLGQHKIFCYIYQVKFNTKQDQKLLLAQPLVGIRMKELKPPKQLSVNIIEG